MKKLITIFLCLCLSLSLFATGLKTSYFNFGVGVSVSGRSDAVSSVSIDATYVPFDFKYGNPALLAWTSASTNGKEGFSFKEVGLGLAIELGRFEFNPLSFVSNNPSPWAPKVTVGVVFNQLEEEEKVSSKLYVEASIFRVLEKDYQLEWFSPFVMINKTYKAWGVTVFRFTPLYHLGKEDKV